MPDPFAELLHANARYAATFAHGGLEANAARGLAVVTCIDSRIEPLQMLGLAPGDAKILRNAGARITDDVLRTLVLATNQLGVEHVAVVVHTDCAATEDDQAGVLASDIDRIHADVNIPGDIATIGLRYDVRTGSLEQLVAPR